MNPPIPLPRTSLEADLDITLPLEPARTDRSTSSRRSPSIRQKRQRDSPSMGARGMDIPGTIPEGNEDEEGTDTASQPTQRRKRAVRATGSAGGSQQVQQGGSELQTSLQSLSETVGSMLKSMSERDELRWDREQQIRQEEKKEKAEKEERRRLEKKEKEEKEERRRQEEKEERLRKEKEDKEERLRKEKEEKEERIRKEELEEKRRKEDKDANKAQMNMFMENNAKMLEFMSTLVKHFKPPGDGSGSSGGKGD